MEGAEVNDAAAAAATRAGVQGNDEEETKATEMQASAAEQPLDNETAAASTADEPAAAAIDLVETTTSVSGMQGNDEEETKVAEVQASAAAAEQPLDNETAAASTVETTTSVADDNEKEAVAPETMNPDERTETSSPGEKKVDDAAVNDAQPPNSNDEILLNFGDTNAGGDAEVTNQDNTAENIKQETTPSNDLDLLGFSQAGVADPSSNANDVLGKLAEATADPQPIHDLLGMPSGGNTSNNAQQPILEPKNSPTENASTEDEVGKDTGEGTASTDSHNEKDASLNEDSREDKLGEVNRNEEVLTQSESVDTGSEKVISLSEKEEDAPPIDLHEKSAVIDASVPEKQNSTETAESNVDGEGANAEGNSVAEEQPNEPHELNNAISQGQETDQVECTTQETNEITKSTVVDNEGAIQSENENVIKTNEQNLVVEEQGIKSEEPNNLFAMLRQEQETGQVVSEPQETPLEDITSKPEPNDEKTTNEVDTNASSGHVNGETEERTEEEEEWISMGLGLGDALRQIVALTEERDTALAICQAEEDGKVQAEALLVEVQSRLGAEMNQRAEFESEVRQARETLKSYEAQLATYKTTGEDLEKTRANLSKIELEVKKLREIRDESEQKEVVLSNRLNEAKKKEANKSTTAGRLEVDNENLREDLQKIKDELDITSKAKTKLESNMEKLKAKAVERVKQAETALAEERELNEERKKKMKVFVETKAEELRDAKENANDMQKELEETRASLRSSRDREEAFQKELDAARLKHREVQRDMERMKRNSEQLHRVGNDLEQELEKSASETEEHKKKRLSAKHEIMQMVRTLEVERSVGAKLKEGIKFTFTPKALSQQELLTECLRDFESELERLAAKMGKTLLPSSETSEQAPGSPALESPINGASRKSKKTRAAKADMDTERLISNLEQETQQVSKGIMALAASIERMRSLLNEDNMFGCMSYLSNIIGGTGEARHQRLPGISDAHEESTNDQFV